ncbi:MAG TPA: DUF1844 domain-containing protein [Bryobacteraceae bacterium]|nr:DUF1844 domain-containing protein [Bryobacteraceae bacterium]
MTDIDTDTRGQQEGRPFPLPPPSFEFLAESLRLQAEMQLGLMHLGGEEQPPPDLELARHTIDLMAMLQEKTRGNLTLEEQRLLENTLTLLRFRYVQVSDEVKKNRKPAESQQQEAAQADSQTA